MGIMNYFDDLRFLAGDIAPRCQSRLHRAHFAHYAVQLILATPEHDMVFAKDDRALQRITSPQLCWHHPGALYSYRPRSAHGCWLHCWVACTGARAHRLVLEGLEPLSDNGLLPLPAREPAYGLFRRLISLQRSGHSGDQAEACLLLEQLLLLALRSHGSQREDPHGLYALAGRIDREPAAAVDFQQEAAHRGWSQDHFRRRFRQLLGRSPHDYLLDRRLQAAATALRSDTSPIASIAAACGFSDRRHFARLFRKRLGSSPRAFRHGR